MKISREEYEANMVRCTANIAKLKETFGLNEADMTEIEKLYPTLEDVICTTEKILEHYIYDSGVEAEAVPKLSLNLSPPASGKSQLNVYSMQKMGGNAVLINSDDIKTYYDKAKTIAHHPKYSVLYSYITDMVSNIATSVLLNECIEKRLNFVFEGTGRTNRILDTIQSVRYIYRIKIRTIAVSSGSSLVSILGRYVQQRQNGINARLVRAEDFFQCYSNIPDLLREAENHLGYHVEVFTRGKEAGRLPIKCYSSNNRNGYDSAVSALQDVRNFNEIISREENMMQVSESQRYLAQTSDRENSMVLIEIMNLLVNMLLIQNGKDDF